jgi:hypothetical protein
LSEAAIKTFRFLFSFSTHRGKIKSSTVGHGIETGEMIVLAPAAASGPDGSSISVRVKVPPMFSRSTGNKKTVEKIKAFFHEEHGAIAVSEGGKFLKNKNNRNFQSIFVHSLLHNP